MSDLATSQATSVVDAVIVGGGAAGLLAADALLNKRPMSRVLLVDAGLPLDERRQAAAPQMGGYGGAGLYLGGRLFVGPSTIPVLPSGTLPDGVSIVLEGEAYLARMEQVNARFTALGAGVAPLNTPPRPLADAVAAAKDAGLDYVTSYPARILPLHERNAVLERLLQQLERSGLQFAFGTRVERVESTAQGFHLALANSQASTHTPSGVLARALILAPGRYGLEWLIEVAGALGMRSLPLPTAFGVRIEILAAAYAPLTDFNPDPRLQVQLKSDATVKTYATCPGGVVRAVTRYGALVASGVPHPPAERGPNTTFAVLLQPGASGAAALWSEGESASRRLNAKVTGRLVVQRLADVRRHKATEPSALAANTVRPSDPEAAPGALRDHYPDAYWEAFETLLQRITRLAPGADTDDTLVYGPAEERFWHFPTDAHLQTNVPGLFVAGDGPGQSQGVIQAGVAGTLAGEGAASYLDA